MIDPVPQELSVLIAAEQAAPVADETVRTAIRAKLGASLAAPATAAVSGKLIALLLAIGAVGAGAAYVATRDGAKEPGPPVPTPAVATASEPVDAAPPTPSPAPPLEPAPAAQVTAQRPARTPPAAPPAVSPPSEATLLESAAAAMSHLERPRRSGSSTSTLASIRTACSPRSATPCGSRS